MLCKVCSVLCGVWCLLCRVCIYIVRDVECVVSGKMHSVPCCVVCHTKYVLCHAECVQCYAVCVAVIQSV